MAVQKKPKPDISVNKAENQSEPSSEMTVEKSELSRNIGELAGRYKKFAFDIASKIPYSSIPSWIKVADGKIEEILDEKRTFMLNLKDICVASIIYFVLTLIAYWYFLVLFAFFFIPALVGIAVVFPLLLLLSSLIGVLLQSAIYHILAKLLGGKASFTDTMSILVLSYAAYIVLSIPIRLSYAVLVGYMFSVLLYVVLAYVLYLQYLGFRHLHGLSQKRAAAVVIGGAAAVVIGRLIQTALIIVLFVFYLNTKNNWWMIW